jgi:hypothetical protein
VESKLVCIPYPQVYSQWIYAMDQGKKSLNQVLLRELLAQVKDLTAQKEESN